ncbi:hypothetical protein PR048_031946 [Dryococelus australis]|uniref:Transposable element P transposase-like RNase H domain-containing protein n=1 Tax=Dryococelus australis TaxID=614101 RepID=A0ABQ9G9I6_9NEOP|nr:hypothetical protein PR048_031946 [Dryococelus australis]
MAEETCKSEMFELLAETVDTIPYKLIVSQIRNKNVKSQGRRFTLNDKILASSIYKQSGKAYRLLAKVFSLPSTQTILFDNLKHSVSKLPKCEGYCCLLFDEMAIQPSLHYSSNNNKIIGWQYYGNNNRVPSVADHVLVFTTIVFMFCQNATKTHSLAVVIKQVIRSVTATGLNVIATVCDQGANNQAAINYLLEETRQQCLKYNIENRKQKLWFYCR